MDRVIVRQVLRVNLDSRFIVFGVHFHVSSLMFDRCAHLAVSRHLETLLLDLDLKVMRVELFGLFNQRWWQVELGTKLVGNVQQTFLVGFIDRQILKRLRPTALLS